MELQPYSCVPNACGMRYPLQPYSCIPPLTASDSLRNQTLFVRSKRAKAQNVSELLFRFVKHAVSVAQYCDAVSSSSMVITLTDNGFDG